MKRNASVVMGLGLAMLLGPTVAYGNVGTPLIWATQLHLVFGNALLGCFEGLLLSKFFKLRRGRCIGLMILANYASAWVGVLLLSTFDPSAGADLYSAPRVILLTIALAYVLTVVLEWPFVLGCFSSKDTWMRCAKATLLVQTCSYVLLFAGFWMVSSHSLYTHHEVVAPDDLSMPDDLVVFYLGSEDGHVYRRSGTDEPVLVQELGATSDYDHLYIRPHVHGTSADLMADVRTEGDQVMILANISFASDPEDALRFLRLPAPFVSLRVGSAKDSPWRFSWSFWPSIGIHGWREDTGKRFSVAMGDPLFRWSCRWPSHLPGEMLLFQLGDDQICLLDVNQRKVSLWGRGRGPVVVPIQSLEEQPEPQDDPSQSGSDP